MASKKKDTTDGAAQTAQTPKTYTLTLPAGFKSKATLSAKLWKWNDGEPKYFRIESAMVKKAAKVTGKDGKQREPATTCSVVDLTQPGSGSQTLIMGAVLADLLNETYPNNGYIGKSFVATRYQQDGKRYKNFEVQELESTDAK